MYVIQIYKKQINKYKKGKQKAESTNEPESTSKEYYNHTEKEKKSK